MATAAVYPSFTDSAPTPTYSLHHSNSSRSRKPSMFKSLKQKFGNNKNDDGLSRNTSFKSQGASSPLANPSAATRRPVNTGNSESDPPPAYTAVSNAAQLAPPTIIASPSSSTSVLADDPYAFLTTFDTVFLIDDSGSMAGGRWRETLNALSTITPICTAHDADGIDIYFLNHPDNVAYHNVTSASTVREIFSLVRPGGATPTGQRLNALLKPYLYRLERAPEGTVKPMNIICITDGEPSDDVESILISAAKRLDKIDAPAWQIGVQFFQVGRDEQARAHLKQLDDELDKLAGQQIRDIVDTVPFTGSEGTTLTGDGILKVVLGAVNRRLDRKKSADLHH